MLTSARDMAFAASLIALDSSPSMACIIREWRNADTSSVGEDRPIFCGSHIRKIASVFRERFWYHRIIISCKFGNVNLQATISSPRKVMPPSFSMLFRYWSIVVELGPTDQVFNEKSRLHHMMARSDIPSFLCYSPIMWHLYPYSLDKWSRSNVR